jgi:hypothetical protein
MRGRSIPAPEAAPGRYCLLRLQFIYNEFNAAVRLEQTGVDQRRALSPEYRNPVLKPFDSARRAPVYNQLSYRIILCQDGGIQDDSGLFIKIEEGLMIPYLDRTAIIPVALRVA